MDRQGHRDRGLLVASAALVGAVALHGIDHALQERGVGALSTEVMVGGTLNAAVAVLALVLVIRNHPRATAVAGFVGAYLAVGVTAAHFAPRWGPVSDPYSELDLGLVSWAAAGAEVVAAAALAAVAFAALRRRRAPAGAAPA
jgi:hypothetical protein